MYSSTDMVSQQELYTYAIVIAHIMSRADKHHRDNIGYPLHCDLTPQPFILIYNLSISSQTAPRTSPYSLGSATSKTDN